MSVHQLTIGDIECVVLQEGAAFMDRDSVIERYPNVDPADVAAALGDSQPSGSLNLLYINSGGTRILPMSASANSARPAWAARCAVWTASGYRRPTWISSS